MRNVEDMPLTVYTPASQLRNPGKLFRSVWSDRDALRELSWRLFVRDLAGQYRQSLFGVLWAFVPSVATGLVFILLKSKSVVQFGETDIPYPVFVLVGVILWQLFVESLNAPLKAVTASKPLIAKIRFPHEALIVSAFYLTLFNLLIKALIIFVVLQIFGVAVTWGLLLAPLAMVALILLGVSVGLLITPLGVLYSDVATSIPVITQLAFFATPVVYPPPQTFPFSLVTVLNPVSPLLIASRDLLTKGLMTNLVPFAIVSGGTVLLLLFAWLIYRIALPILVERMSS